MGRGVRSIGEKRLALLSSLCARSRSRSKRRALPPLDDFSPRLTANVALSFASTNFSFLSIFFSSSENVLRRRHLMKSLRISRRIPDNNYMSKFSESISRRFASRRSNYRSIQRQLGETANSTRYSSARSIVTGRTSRPLAFHLSGDNSNWRRGS